MSHETSLITGLATLLAANQVGVYDPTGVLPDGATGIIVGRLPDEPNQAIGLTTYPVADDDSTDSVTGVQARIRAGTAATDVLDLSDLVFGVLHNRRSYVLNGVWVEISWRNSEAWIGQDTRGRMERSANYYVRTVRSGAHLID
ncbi:minor capsid protein [Streptomyces sp. NPDC058847]|uniref:minor capsid protein n=1 Tax=Streptomyces sp. NPDC058847 TaxID=3346649 RepID=UPI003686A8DC